LKKKTKDDVPLQQLQKALVPVHYTHPVGTFRCQASVTLDSRAVAEHFPALIPDGMSHTFESRAKAKTISVPSDVRNVCAFQGSPKCTQ